MDKPKLLIKKKIKDFTNRQLRWYELIENAYGYEINYDISTDEIEVWRVKPYG